MDGSVGVLEWPILILEGRERWEWVQFSGMMGGKEGHPKKMDGTQVCKSQQREMSVLDSDRLDRSIDEITSLAVLLHYGFYCP